jgi:hypothetical protein
VSLCQFKQFLDTLRQPVSAAAKTAVDADEERKAGPDHEETALRRLPTQSHAAKIKHG